VRILFVTHNVPRHPGDAAGSFVLRLAVALQAQGARVEVIAPGAAGLAAEGTLEGVRITRVAYGPPASMTLAYEGTMAESVRASWSARVALVRLLRALRREARGRVAQAIREGDRYDVVHAHWWFPAGLALWRALPRAETSPDAPLLAITMHGSDVRLAQGIAPARRLMRAVLGRAALRTAVSSWLADAASRIAPDGRVYVAPMPVDVRHFSGGAAAGVRRNGILFVGRLNAQKGLADLLDALAHPALRRASLRVVGDGPEGGALRARAASLGVDSRVTWLGALPQAELAAQYRAASVVAMPSTEEGLGLVAVEAQLCETPVVAYASGGLPDVVRIDAGGTLVTPGDRDAFATAIARLLDDPVRAARDGQTAREAMLAHFAPEGVAAHYLALYEEARRA
jgi:glycosyltransferase involved in cell wall biosynthesis